MEVVTSTPNGHPFDAASVLRDLAELGYEGIATAVRQAREQTGLAPDELAIRLGLPADAVVLWAQGSFIPRIHHLLRLGKVLADHASHPPRPWRPPDQRQPAHGDPLHHHADPAARASTLLCFGDLRLEAATPMSPSTPSPRPHHQPADPGAHGAPGELPQSACADRHLSRYPARIYDWLLGSKDNFVPTAPPVSRSYGPCPTASTMARANRAFLQRAVRFLAAEAGISCSRDTHGRCSCSSLLCAGSALSLESTSSCRGCLKRG